MAFLFPSTRNSVNQPNYPDGRLRVQTALVGLPRAIGCGQDRTGANLLDYVGFYFVPKSSGAGKGAILGAGGTSTGQYEYFSTPVFGIGEGPITTIKAIWDGTHRHTPIGLHFNVHAGGYSQAPDPYLATHYPLHAFNYRGMCYLISYNLDMGSSSSLPNFNYEVLWRSDLTNALPGFPDCAPAAWITAFLTDEHWGAEFPPSFLDTLTIFNDYTLSLGFIMSDVLTTGQQANAYLKNLAEAFNSEFVWNSSKLTIVPYGDVAVTGNGYTYTPIDLSTVPIFMPDDFLKNQGSSNTSGSLSADTPIMTTRTPQAMASNSVKVEYLERSNYYNPTEVEAMDDASIADFGYRPMANKSYHFLKHQKTALLAAHLQLGRQYIRNLRTWTAPQNWIFLDPMDIVKLNDGKKIINLPVRIKEITENQDSTLTFIGEDYIQGTASAPDYSLIEVTPPPAPTQCDPGLTQAVIIDANCCLDPQGPAMWAVAAPLPPSIGVREALTKGSITFGFQTNSFHTYGGSGSIEVFLFGGSSATEDGFWGVPPDNGWLVGLVYDKPTKAWGIEIYLQSGGGGDSFFATMTIDESFVANAWYGIAIQFDTAGSICKLFVNGVDKTDTGSFSPATGFVPSQAFNATNGVCAFMPAIGMYDWQYFPIARPDIDAATFSGDIGFSQPRVQLGNMPNFADPTVYFNYFGGSGNAPADYGPDGSAPEGLQPVFYWPDDTSNLGANKGTTGGTLNLVTHGIGGTAAPANATGIPANGSYQAKGFRLSDSAVLCGSQPFARAVTQLFPAIDPFTLSYAVWTNPICCRAGSPKSYTLFYATNPQYKPTTRFGSPTSSYMAINILQKPGDATKLRLQFFFNNLVFFTSITHTVDITMPVAGVSLGVTLDCTTTTWTLKTVVNGSLVDTYTQAASVVATPQMFEVDGVQYSMGNAFGWDAVSGENSMVLDGGHLDAGQGEYEASQPWLALYQLVNFVTSWSSFFDGSNSPKNLGSNGATPTGVAPQFYFPGDASTLGQNTGSGPSLITPFGTVTSATTVPAAGGYQAKGLHFAAASALTGVGTVAVGSPNSLPALGSGVLTQCWGGCNVWVSTDGGNSYGLVGQITLPSPIGTITGLTGTVDPDVLDTPTVDLTNSQQTLPSFSRVDADAGLVPCVAGNELISYETATLVSLYNYTLSYIRRGLYETVISSHGAGSEFAMFDHRTPGKVLRIPYPSSMDGQTVLVKFQSFDMLGGNAQDLSIINPIPVHLNGGVPPVAPVTASVFESGAYLTLTWDPAAGCCVNCYSIGYAASLGGGNNNHGSMFFGMRITDKIPIYNRSLGGPAGPPFYAPDYPLMPTDGYVKTPCRAFELSNQGYDNGGTWTVPAWGFKLEAWYHYDATVAGTPDTIDPFFSQGFMTLRMEVYVQHDFIGGGATGSPCNGTFVVVSTPITMADAYAHFAMTWDFTGSAWVAKFWKDGTDITDVTTSHALTDHDTGGNGIFGNNDWTFGGANPGNLTMNVNSHSGYSGPGGMTPAFPGVWPVAGDWTVKLYAAGLSQLWLGAGQTVDPSNSTEWSKFYTNTTTRASLGARGATPTGVIPFMYLPTDDISNPGKNVGLTPNLSNSRSFFNYIFVDGQWVGATQMTEADNGQPWERNYADTGWSVYSADTLFATIDFAMPPVPDISGFSSPLQGNCPRGDVGDVICMTGVATTTTIDFSGGPGYGSPSIVTWSIAHASKWDCVPAVCTPHQNWEGHLNGQEYEPYVPVSILALRSAPTPLPQSPSDVTMVVQCVSSDSFTFPAPVPGTYDFIITPINSLGVEGPPIVITHTVGGM